MLATACLNGRLWNWLSLHPDNTKAHQEEEDGKSFVWDKRDMAVTYEHACFVMILSFSHCLQVSYKKTCLKGGNGLAETFFRHNHFCHACHTGFAVFFPILPSYCVSLLKQSKTHLYSLAVISIQNSSLEKWYTNKMFFEQWFKLCIWQKTKRKTQKMWLAYQVHFWWTMKLDWGWTEEDS